MPDFADLPMFPLGTAVLPSAVLPLHIFEPRYRQLVVDCLASDDIPPVFGSTLIERGSEVGGGDQRAGLGVLIEMHQVEATPDGRYLCVGVGITRLRIVRWLDDDPYPRAAVEPWPDPDAADPALVQPLDRARQRVTELLALAAQLGAHVPAGGARTSDVPGPATYQLGVLAPLGPADRYRLLAAPTARQRLTVLDEVLDDAESTLRFQLG